MKKKNRIGLIGYGRFGRVLHGILSKENDVCVYDEYENDDSDVVFVSFDEVVDVQLLYIAVPIREFEGVIKKISGINLYNTTIIDVCSVKVYPVNIMNKYLDCDVGIIATHPHFGPDSFSPYRELKASIYPVRDCHNVFSIVKNIYESFSIRTINMDPEEHDRIAASSQGITHFMGRVLNEYGIKSTEINTLGFTGLLSVIEQTCNDSWELFKDLQKYNPYTNDMIDGLISKIEEVKIQLAEDDN